MGHLRLLAKRFLPFSLFVLLTGLLFKGLSNDPTDLPTALLGKPFPDFSSSDLISGVLIGTDSLSFRPALVNVWATWCYSCQVEHAYLLKLDQMGIPIYGLNYKDDPRKASAWLTKLGNPYKLTIVDLDGAIGMELGVYGAPETFVIGPDARIVHRHTGIMNEEVFAEEMAHWFKSFMIVEEEVELTLQEFNQ